MLLPPLHVDSLRPVHHCALRLLLRYIDVVADRSGALLTHRDVLPSVGLLWLVVVMSVIVYRRSFLLLLPLVPFDQQSLRLNASLLDNALHLACVPASLTADQLVVRFGFLNHCCVDFAS